MPGETPSKRVADNLNKTSKDAKRVEKMETTFTVTERSIKEMVQQTVQQQMSKFPVTRGKPKPVKIHLKDTTTVPKPTSGKKKPFETEITTNAKARQAF